MSSLVICHEIRRVKGGFIVVIRPPYGYSSYSYSEAICKTWDEVLELLTRACPEKERISE